MYQGSSSVELFKPAALEYKTSQVPSYQPLCSFIFPGGGISYSLEGAQDSIRKMVQTRPRVTARMAGYNKSNVVSCLKCQALTTETLKSPKRLSMPTEH